MAREDLEINIRERGARSVSRAIDDIARSADRATKDLFLLVRAFRAVRDAAILLGGFGAVSEFIRQLDQITLYENRIRLVTGSFAELRTVYSELIETAVRSRSPLESIVELYSRSALSAKELGVSQKEVIQFTESVAKAATLSGATVREANAALIQLSQGIASNRLGGDELRSILEQLPFVADVIAKSLGVTRGELRKLGSEGKITGEVVLKAFRDARVEIDTLFNKTVSTVAQSLNVLGVRFLESFGQLDDYLGITETLSRAILTLADNFDALAGSVAALTAAFAVFFTLRYVTTIGTLITLVATLAGGFLALSRILLTSPIALVAAALTAAYIAARTFGNEIAIVEGKMNTYGDVAQAAFELSYEAVRDFAGEFVDSLDGIVVVAARVFANLGINIPRTFDDLVKSARDWANATIGVFVGISKALPFVMERLPGAIGEVFHNMAANVIFIVENMINGLISLVESGMKAIFLPVATFLKENTGFLPGDGSLAEQVSNFASAIENFSNLDRVFISTLLPEPTFSNYGSEIAQIVKDTFTDELLSTDFVGIGIEKVLARSGNIALEREIARIQNEADLTKPGRRTTKDLTDGKGRKRTFADFVRELTGQNEALKVNSTIREKLLKIVSVEKSLRRSLTPEERAIYLALLDTNQALERQSEIFDSLREPQRAYGILIRDLAALLAQGRISIQEYNKEMSKARIELLGLSENFLDGVERAFLKAYNESTDYASQAESLFTTFSNGMTEAIVNFVKTGKLSLKDFFAEFLLQIVRLYTNRLFLQFIDLLTGGVASNNGSSGRGLLSGLLGSVVSGLGSLLGGGPTLNAANAVSTSAIQTTPLPPIFGAKGLVLNSPAFVGYRGSSPVIGGEAGPEGLFPLARNSLGDLAVRGEKSVIEISLTPELVGQILEQANQHTVQLINSPTMDTRIAKANRTNENSRRR